MALLSNKKWTSQSLSLKDGVLRTNGALVSMKMPADWQTKKTSRFSYPGLADETFLSCETGDENAKCSLGIFFSGKIDDEDDGRRLRQEIFEKQITMKKDSAEATQFHAEEGGFANVTQLGYALLSTAPHAVPSEEKDCLAFRTGEIKCMRAAIFEFESERFGTKSIEYCIDISGNGRVIYSLFYKAPTATFQQHFSLAKEVFESSIWRTDFDPTVNLEAVD